MRKVLIPLGLLLVVAATFLYRPKDEQLRELKPTKSRGALSDRDVTVNQNEEGDRFEGLDPRFHALVVQLEEDFREWAWESGPFYHSQIRWYEQREFARARTAELSVEEIAGLLAWIGKGGSGCYRLDFRYREGLFWNWGKKDGRSALEFLKGYSEREDDWKGDSRFSRSFAKETGYIANFIFEGWAESDAAAAWEFFDQTYEKLEEDKYSLLGPVEGILRGLTAQNAEAAWELIVSGWWEPSIERNMVSGYIAGLSGNQDWAEVALKVEAIVEDESLREALRQELVKRWFFEDDDAALSWYQDHFSFGGNPFDPDPFSATESNISNLEIAVQFGFTEQELWNRKKWGLLQDIGWSQGGRGNEALISWAKKRLPNEGAEAEFLLRGVIFEGGFSNVFQTDWSSDEKENLLRNHDFERQLSPDGIAYFPLVAYLPPEVARRQFMSILNSLPEILDSRDPANLGGWTFDCAKMAREVTGKLVEEVPLSVEERAQAEVVFARLDEQERVLLEGWKREAEGSE